MERRTEKRRFGMENHEVRREGHGKEKREKRFRMERIKKKKEWLGSTTDSR